jgi:DNA-binding NarL/FixJ family response regulator
MIKIALADDEPLFRKGVAGLLRNYPQYEIIYSVSDGEDLLEEIEEKKILPDIFLLDLRMKRLDGIETTKALSKKYNDCKIIILTSFYSPSFVNFMVNLGVNAFLSKFIEPSELVFAIDMVADKGLYLTEDYANAIRSKVRTQKKPSFNSQESLTKRELEVLYWISHGATNQEISDKINRSVRTIEGHRLHIMEKTGAKNTAGMVVYALMHKIIDIDQKLLDHTLA